MSNRNEIFILAARFKVSAAHFSKLHRAARSAGINMDTSELLKANAPDVSDAIDKSNADQYALLDFIKALPDLHLFLIGDSDWVAGEDAEQAWRHWGRATGCSREEVDGEIKQEPDDKPIACTVGADGMPCEDGDDGSTKVTRTAGEWAALLGPGFAFSEND